MNIIEYVYTSDGPVVPIKCIAEISTCSFNSPEALEYELKRTTVVPVNSLYIRTTTNTYYTINLDLNTSLAGLPNYMSCADVVRRAIIDSWVKQWTSKK